MSYIWNGTQMVNPPERFVTEEKPKDNTPRLPPVTVERVAQSVERPFFPPQSWGGFRPVIDDTGEV